MPFESDSTAATSAGAADQPQDAPELEQVGDGAEAGEGSSEYQPQPGDETETTEGEGAEGAQGEGDGEGEGEAEPRFDPLQDLTPRQQQQYAQRYPKAWARLNDPTTTDDDRQLLIDKINSDLELQRRKAGQDGEEGEEAEGLEAEQEGDETEADPNAAAAAVPQTPEEQKAAYYKYVDTLVGSVVDPQAQTQLGTELLAGFGVNVDVLKDPNASPEEKAEVQALVNNAPKVGKVLTRAAVDLMATVMPHMLQGMVEQVFPQFGEMHERSSYALAWEEVQGTQLRDGSKPYANLPAYGSKEFSQVLLKAREAIPGFDKMRFTGKDGRLLPPGQQAREKYRVLAKVASGQRVNPAEIAQAVQTGQRQATRAERRRQQGKALGSGQSTQSFASRGGDEFRQAIESYNRAQRSTERG